MSEKENLLMKLSDCDHAFGIARRNEKWDEAQESCEAKMNICRRLHLLELQTAEETKL